VTGPGYGRFAVTAAAVALLLAVAGAVPARAWAGGGGLAALLTACGISLVASLAAGVPIARAARREDAAAPVIGGLAASAVRVVVVVALLLAAALGSGLPRVPLLVWTAVSYLVLLVVDTLYALAATGRPVPLLGRREKDGGRGSR
jgi:hypothetical protein